MGKFIDLTGVRFGRLTAVYRTENIGKATIWHCRCDCGNEIDVRYSSLYMGRTKSCGCLRKEVTSKMSSTHHQTNTRLYVVWCGMKERCFNKNSKQYHRYGGRGITICDEWLDFAAFSEWAYANGYDPDAEYQQCTIDRIDNDKGYCPSNCRWTTNSVQSRNKSHYTLPKKYKPVTQIDENGNEIESFKSIQEASRSTGIPEAGISKVVTGSRAAYKGTRWRYVS